MVILEIASRRTGPLRAGRPLRGVCTDCGAAGCLGARDARGNFLFRECLLPVSRVVRFEMVFLVALMHGTG
jgi:hypothetical protein